MTLPCSRGTALPVRDSNYLSVIGKIKGRPDYREERFKDKMQRENVITAFLDTKFSDQLFYLLVGLSWEEETDYN